MNVICPECKQEYDDVDHRTHCPHDFFEMHVGVFVNGQNGCAHTIEELNNAHKSGVAPNPSCPLLLMQMEIMADIEC